MVYIIAVPLLILAVLVQRATFHVGGPFGARPDLLLILVGVWAVIRSREEAMLAGPPAALLAGLLSAGPIGLPLLTLLGPIGCALPLREDRRARRLLPKLVLVIALSTLWSSSLDLIVGFLTGQHGINLSGLGQLALGAVVVNVSFAILLYVPFRLARKSTPARSVGLSLS